MQIPNRAFPQRMNDRRFPVRSWRWPIGMRQRALTPACAVKMRPVWAIEIPRSFAYRGKKANSDPHAYVEKKVATQQPRTARLRMISPKSDRCRRWRAPDAESRHGHPHADDRGGDREGGPEPFRRDRSAEARSKRHPEVKGGRVPPVRTPEEAGRAGIPDVGHHGGGEAGEPHPGEEVDEPDVKRRPGREQ
jgi:hypothetical protein